MKNTEVYNKGRKIEEEIKFLNKEIVKYKKYSKGEVHSVYMFVNNRTSCEEITDNTILMGGVIEMAKGHLKSLISQVENNYKQLEELGIETHFLTPEEKLVEAQKEEKIAREEAYKIALEARKKFAPKVEKVEDTKPVKENNLNKEDGAYEYHNLRAYLLEKYGQYKLKKVWGELGLTVKNLDSLLSCKAVLEENAKNAKNKKKTVKKPTKKATEKDVIINNSQNLENPAAQATVSA